MRAAPTYDESDPLDTEASIREAVGALEQDVVAALRRLTGRLYQAEHTSSQAEEGSIGIHRRTGDLREAAETASLNSSALATATQQVSDAAEQVGSSMNGARDMLEAAATRAGEATQMMTGLAIATVEIRSIVDSIAEIARQTNLLALNATIEASRAGESGRGFAVVAQEVKALSVEVREAVDHIRSRVDRLAQTAQGSAGIVNDALQMVRDVNPVIAAIGSAAHEQAAAAAELSRSADETARFIDTVSRQVGEIDEMALMAAARSAEARGAMADGARQSEGLLVRFVPLLRHTAFADRRQHDRFPAEYPVQARFGSDSFSSQTVDLGLGGALLAGQGTPKVQPGLSGSITIADLPPLVCRLMAKSELGLHVAFDGTAVSDHEPLRRLLDEIEQSYRPLIDRAQHFAARIAALYELALRQGKLSEADLFDIDYQPVAGTDPQQFTHRALPALEALLPPILAEMLGSDPRLVFAVPIDRNGYIPVHNVPFAQKQRPGETVWNTANSRNRRIFDDRAGIMAARSVRPFLVQSYHRDMGGGVTHVMREVDAPLRINGRHWGGVRMAYRM
ncbi:methyl-accepting chemotaxis protein [Bosea caraganae]|nr:methyl-accepting chemotaxis protein [Bosea caraganae]